MVSVTPYLQIDKLGDYHDKIVELYKADAALSQAIPPSIRKSVEWLLRQVNCYYSNKIEGNPTHPKELLRTQDSTRTSSADELPVELLELLVHLEAQLRAQNAAVSLKSVCSEQFIKQLHRSFYAGVPEVVRRVKDKDGREVIDESGEPFLVVPGEYRQREVKVGKHLPPLPKDLPAYMSWTEQVYNPERIYGTVQVVAAAALHHRLAWIHPFQDGNGRVLRLLTDCYMRCAGFGGYGLWSITRGFGRNTAAYYTALSEADKPRQGSSDGKGILSDQGLLDFTKYFIDTALDQVHFFSELLEPRKLAMRIDVYFEMRSKGALPDINGKELPLLRITARDIYKFLLERGPKSRAEICQYLDKGEQTLRPILKQMDSEGLIKLKPKRDIELKLSTASLEFLFPHLW